METAWSQDHALKPHRAHLFLLTRPHTYRSDTMKKQIKKVSQIKSKVLEPELRKNVFEKPDFLGKIASRGERGGQIARLAYQLTNIATNECVVFDLGNFREKFAFEGNIKSFLPTLRVGLRNREAKRVRWYIDEDMQKIYFWLVFSSGPK